MGKRLSKIYTTTGDQGETGLGDGSRVPKTHARVVAMGAVDELNTVIGLLIATLNQKKWRQWTRIVWLLAKLKRKNSAELGAIADFLAQAQHRIFDLGGEISIPNFTTLTQGHVAAVEVALDYLNDDLEPLANFVLPGGSALVAQCHQARSVCRRAERCLAALAETDTINPASLAYLNRLSDYLFVAARSCAHITGVDEVLWKQE
ncbi:MAG: cob(I)yrinic acid a,c-diamide adenosyltransferase [Pseudomonadales bacterium]